jgi:primase-polymerase (primpol)-like protein
MAIGGWWCSVTDPSHWSTFADAVSSEVGDGVGFVLNGDGIVCLDLDDCVVDGVPTEAAQKFLNEFPGAYVEFSPSGRGLHVWGRGFMDRGRRFTLDGLKVEAYPDGRYITVTGNVYRSGGLPVLDLHRITTA